MSAEQRVAVYIHLPFCRTRCGYCGFNTYAGLEHLMPAYADGLAREIRQVVHGRSPDTRLAASSLYFGGGTPSILPLELLARLLNDLHQALDVLPDAEVTLEANPGTVSPAYLHTLRRLGINRLSLGVQSAHEDELGLLGRAHSWPQAVQAVRAARQAGFDNLNLDLIYGLPGQTLVRWQQTLEAALRLEPNHLSLYALTVEDGTPLQDRIAQGHLPAPDEDLAAEMYEWAEERLAVAGFVHYEISNWAGRSACWPVPAGEVRAGCSRTEDLTPWAARHNLTYWRNEPYRGLGAGAASWWEGRRWTNIRHPQAYIAALERGQTPVDEVEDIPLRTEMGETMMMGLRLAEGVSDARFRSRFGLGLTEAFGEPLARMRDLGLLEWDGQAVRLTARGRLLGNQVFQEFLPG